MTSLATATFIRVELSRQHSLPPAEPVFVLINVDHIVRIHPGRVGSTLVLDDDTSLNVCLTLTELAELLRASNGGVRVLA